MNKFEFISLKEYPEGQYPTAIATVRINHIDSKGYPCREIVRYARKEMKTGGHFWTMATHSVLINGEKKYIPGFQNDSGIENEMLIEFIKENVKSEANPIAQNGSMYGQSYPNGQVQQRQTAQVNNIPYPMPPMPDLPQASEVAPNDNLPF